MLKCLCLYLEYASSVVPFINHALWMPLSRFSYSRAPPLQCRLTARDVCVRFEVPLYLIPLNPGSWGVDRSYLKRNRTIGDVFENFHNGLVVHLNDAGWVDRVMHI